MLSYLRIRHLALLDEATLEFRPGFTVVTGETGAGKSVLLGALALLAGARGDRSLIRQGADACELEAVLELADPDPANALLEEAGLPRCEDGQLVLKRVLPRERPPRILVNGSVATLAALERLGGCWVDFHGPSEPRRLLKPDGQLELLDLYGGTAAHAERFRQPYARWRRCRQEIDAVQAETRLAPEQVDFLRQQLDRIDRLAPTAASIEALERDYQRIQSGQEIEAACAGLIEGFSGDKGIAGRLAHLVRQARTLTALDPSSAPLAERVAGLAVEAEDIAAEIRRLGSDLQFDPRQAAAIEERMSAWLDCQRRYGPDLDSVLRARADLERRLALQGDIDGRLERLRAEAAEARAEAVAAARPLRAAREQAAARLGREMAPLLAGLGFKRADFEARVLPEPELGPHGDCRVEFYFAPNPGEPLHPLHRIASSGELARVMLALKSILARADRTPVLVFDEVDANVGGEIGGVVGRLLAEVGAGHQVLCVTHLPQVAAQARHHFLVEKSATAERTTVAIHALHGDRERREGELARMLGDRTSASARAHAAQLLQAAAGP